MARLTVFGAAVLFGTLTFLIGTGYGIALWLYSISALRVYAEFLPATCTIVGREQQQQVLGTMVTYRGMLTVRFNNSNNVEVIGYAFDSPSKQYSLGEKTEWLSRWIVGAQYPCFYDVRDFTTVSMERGLPWYVFVTLIAPTALMIALGVLAVISCCREPKTKYGSGEGGDDGDGSEISDDDESRRPLRGED